MKKVLGIVGGVGAGKSTVMRTLGLEYGAYLISADEVGHRVMEPGQACYDEVVKAFGKGILAEDGTIDRSVLGKIVFGDPEALAGLNGLVHPAVRRELAAEVKQAPEGLVAMETALPEESDFPILCNEIWFIYVPAEIRVRRLMETRGYIREKALSMIAQQPSDAYYRRISDRIIDNSGRKEGLIRTIAALLGEGDCS